MRTTSLSMAATILALGASFGAAAQDTKDVTVIRGETIVVQSPYMRGAYLTEKDNALLNTAVRALNADKYTNKALLTVIAQDDQLTVIGTTTDLSQSSRVIMKLKGLPGVRKVYAFLDTMGSGDSN